jgi:hypothetical protein
MNNKRSKSKLKFKRKSKGSNIQSRHVVGPKDYRKKKYMRDPGYDTRPTTYYPDRRVN